MGLHGRTSRTGAAILTCCFLSLFWASATAVGAPRTVLSLFDGFRLSAWLLFAVALITIRTRDGSGLGRAYFIGAASFCFVAVADDVWTLIVAPGAPAFFISQVLLRIGFG